MAEMLTTELTTARRYAESLMADLCDVSYRTGETAQNEDTGREESVWAFRFTSRCKVQARSVALTETDTAGRQLVMTRFEVHLPVGVGAVEPDDRVTIVEVGPASDPQLLDRVFNVRGYIAKSYPTAVRLEVEEAVT